MNCREMEERAEAYAFEMLEPEERAACAAHLAEPGAHACQAAVDEARAVLELLLQTAEPARPSDGLWRRVEADVRRRGTEGARAETEGALKTPVAPPATRRSWVARAAPWAGWLVAAVFAAWALLNLLRAPPASGEHGHHEDPGDHAAMLVAPKDAAAKAAANVLSALGALVAEPGARTIALAPSGAPAGPSGAVVLDASAHRGVLIARGLPPIRTGAYNAYLAPASGPAVPVGRLWQLDDEHLGVVLDASALAAGPPARVSVRLYAPSGEGPALLEGAATPGDSLPVKKE